MYCKHILYSIRCQRLNDYTRRCFNIDISPRAKSILNLFYRKKGYISMNDIAKKLNLTERTIYREMSDIKDNLSSLYIQLEIRRAHVRNPVTSTSRMQS